MCPRVGCLDEEGPHRRGQEHGEGTRFGITHNPEEILQCDEPTGVAWASLELHRANQEKKNEEEDQENPTDVIPGIDDICEQHQKAVILVGHGINRVSWFRRVHVLSSIGLIIKKLMGEQTILKFNIVSNF